MAIYTYYDIYPRTLNSIPDELSRQTPILVNGKKFRGLTNWHINWKFNWRSIDDYCEITSASVDLQVIFTMPRIPDDWRVSGRVRRAFNQYYAALMEHELGHARYGELSAMEVAENLYSLGQFKSCKNLEAEANRSSRLIVEKYKKLNKLYDIETEHGRTQGADPHMHI